ncbi:uncharacterized protein LOC143047982 [Mytilus galloprovincialis]|uniref:uncharacterized protein LOC143047982 n=1 Tax=Mytilus galloprovincialis TaxID=29158 RepID=UPI003F7BE7CB
MAYASSTFSKYNAMCQKIVDDLNSDDIKHLKFSLRSTLTNGELANIEDGQDLITTLEKRDLLSQKNVSLLHNLLEKKCGRLATIVSAYDLTITPQRTYNKDKYDISSMNIVEHFVKTSAADQVFDLLKNKGAAFIKGPNGVGKSQIAFWYANHFYKENKKSVIWRINSKSLESTHLSLATLLSTLNNYEDHLISQKKLSQCVTNMFDIVIRTLESEQWQQHQHLIVMDDIFNPKDDIMYEMLQRFINLKNVNLLATSNVSYPTDLASSYEVQISGMTPEEAISLLTSASEDKGCLKKLVKNLNYLPLAISLASSYIKTTKISIRDYLRNISAFQMQAQQEDKKGQNLQASYDMTLKNVENNLSSHCKRVLSLIPYLSHTSISVDVLKTFLPEKVIERELEITNLMSALQNYSLASARRSGNIRLLEMHGLSVWVLKNKKSSEQEKEDLLWLLKHYCREMAIDVRLVKNVNRNMEFLDHACLLMNTYLKMLKNSSDEVLVYEAYLALCIGSTFRIYGRTEITAEDFFERGRKIIAKLGKLESPIYPVPSTANRSSGSSFDMKEETGDMENFLKGDEIIQNRACQIFSALHDVHTCVTEEMLEHLVMKKYRNDNEMSIILCNTSHIDENMGRWIPDVWKSDLIKRGLIIPLHELRATFLIELLTILLYNSNGNNWWINESEAVHAFVEGRHMSVDSKCFAEFQLTYNMACILNSFYEDRYPSFRPVIATVIKRSSVLYYVRNDTLNHTVSEMKNVITFLEGMLESSPVINILIGVINMLSGLDVDHTCHVLELLRECYIKLSNIDENNQNYYITQALAKTSLLESYIEDLEPWNLLPRVHLAIADMCVRIKTPSMARKAKKHFRLAIQDNANDEITRYTLKSYKCYIEFCISQGDGNDLEEAESLCKIMIGKFQNSSKNSYFKQKCEKINELKETRALESTRHKHINDRPFIQNGSKLQIECDAVPDQMTPPDYQGENQVSTQRNSIRNVVEERLVGIDSECLSIERERHDERLSIERERLSIERERLSIEKERLNDAKKTNEILERLISQLQNTR